MTSPDNQPEVPQAAAQDMEQRIQRLIDGDLTAEELAALETELMESPEAMETYRAYLDLDCALEEQIDGEREVSSQSVVPVDRIVAMQRRFHIKVATLGAAAIVLLAALGMWILDAPENQPPLTKFRIAPGSDFTLTHSGEGDAPTGKTMVEGSRLSLLHGVAELKLPHDVRAVVEAPAEMVLRHDRTLELIHGRALFQVNSKDGQGFTVVTPHQRIVDLGTSFGIDLPEGRDEIELHVLEGQVRVDSKDGKHGETIKATRAVQLAGTQVLREIDNPSIGFLRNLPPKINMLVNEDFATGLIAGQNYVIRMDPYVIRDLSGKGFGGIDDDTTWNFTATPTIITPVAASSPTPAIYGDMDTLIDGSGLSGSGVSGVSGDILTETHDYGAGANSWHSNNDNGPTTVMTFDLGGTFTVDSIHIWNWIGHNGVINRSVKTVDISFSTDGGITYGNLIDNLGEFAKPASTNRTATPIATVPVSTITFPAAVSGVTHIKLTDFQNHGDPYTGMSEIRFGEPKSSVDNRFSDWIAQFPHVGDQTGIDDDPDGDRLSNGLEAQFGTHPGQWTPIPTPALTPALTPAPAPSAITRDNSPPIFIAAYPADDSTSGTRDGQLKMLFDKPIKLGPGRVFIQNITNWDESVLVFGDHRLSIDDRMLMINPPIELKDGIGSPGWLAGWKTDAPVTFLNPRGDGKWYDNDELQDDSPSQGMSESMHSRGMTSINQPIRREIGTITAENRYTVSAAIGVRAKNAKNPSTFLGYTIRMKSGDTVLAQLTSNTPPGPPSSVNTVSFSWDATTLPDGVQPGDSLSIEIIPNRAKDLTPGYLDLNALRISVLDRTGK
tara:strand:+ start:579 stop:3089 length:2511 start_codon:yes stop_codon:yes gene_type:complete